MDDTTTKALELWAAYKAAVEQLEAQITKNVVKHNVSAGVRVRKGIRELRKLGQEFVRATLAVDEAVVAERAAKREAAGLPKKAPPPRKTK